MKKSVYTDSFIYLVRAWTVCLSSIFCFLSLLQWFSAQESCSLLFKMRITFIYIFFNFQKTTAITTTTTKQNNNNKKQQLLNCNIL